MNVEHTVGSWPIKAWAEELEDSCLAQAQHLARLPFAYHHIALMPDAHMGYGMPIGGVLATRGVVIPNAVGVDIGCGMHLQKTTMRLPQWEQDGAAVMHRIMERIPVGFNKHEKAQGGWTSLPIDAAWTPVTAHEYEKSCKSLGTLGGGNHFIEFQVDSMGAIYFMIHSGSRNLGKQICDHYNKVAKQLNALYYSFVDPKWDLAFLPLSTAEAKQYMLEQDMALKFAKLNRATMAGVIDEMLPGNVDLIGDALDVHHNYASMEHHFGENVLVHRKGAVRARETEVVVIPGTMGSASYIAIGRGNRDSFNSCSHGAGRRMGRNAAKKDLAVRQTLMDMKTAIYSPSFDVTDEAPGAYKDIEAVMDQQQDLVRRELKLTPLAVIKA